MHNTIISLINLFFKWNIYQQWFANKLQGKEMLLKQQHFSAADNL